MKYEKIKQLNQAEIEAAILRNNPDELSIAVLSVALYAEDVAWAEDVCVRLAAHENEKVRGNAILGFGHIARIHGQLTETKVKRLIESAFDDGSAFVRGQAESAEDDVRFFLDWRLKPKKKPHV